MSLPRELHQLLDAAPDAMVLVDREGLVTALNLAAKRFFGWTEADVLGEPLTRFIPFRFHALLVSAVQAPGGSVSCFARRQDGSESPVELIRRPLELGVEGPSLVTFRDLTHWRRAQEPHSRHNDQARAALESIGDAVITTDASTRITFLNPFAESVTGWDADEALGQPLDVVLPLISEATRLRVNNTAARCLEEGRAIDLEEGVLLVRRDGTEVPIGDSAAPIRDRQGDLVGVVLVIQNESEKRRVGQRLSYEASHDALTGLTNRREFERRLGRVVADLGNAPSEQILLCLDLDRFKIVNDSCGHDAGDELLRSLGPLFGKYLRKRDTLARLGGDEFAILLENCPLTEAQRIAESIRVEIEHFRFEWAGKTFAVTASIGMLQVTAEGGAVATVLRAADAACYTAKEDGGNRVHVEIFSPASSAGTSMVLARRVTRLARAVDESHFQLYAQPIVPLQPETPERSRFEVLLRLPDAQGRVQAAADFLPQAERHNLMPAIDRWVIRETIALLGGWLKDHPDSEAPLCSINLSASALAEDSLLLVLEQQLSKYGIPAGTLCFEVTETAALANLPRTVRFLNEIRTTGCGVALEDFGGGVTSFTYLRLLPVDYLKIGGQFIREVAADPVCGSIVGAVSQIGRSLGIRTIAKQVGSEQALERLRTLGVDFAQGRALTPPLPMTDAGGRVAMQSLQRSA